MELIKLEIITSSKEALQSKLFENLEKKITYIFKDNTLITSNGENSKGKTTLVRFLLYALGYEIPLTDGMDFYNYKTSLKLKIKEEKFELIREKKVIYIKNGEKNIKSELGKTVNTLLGINDESLLDNVLGSFYIDQEKGWTLLNRGKIIGNRKFNMLDFLIGINSLNELKGEIAEIKDDEINIDKLKVLEGVEKYNKNYYVISEEINPTIKDEEDLKNGVKNLELSIIELTRRTNKLKKIKNNNDNLASQIENLNLIIIHNGEEILVTHENIVGSKMETKLLGIQINENEIKIDEFKKQKRKLDIKLKKYDYTGLNIGSIFNKIDELDLPWKNISELKKIKQKNKTMKYNNIKQKIGNNIDEYWNKLRPILIDLKVSKEYLNKDIILTNKLKGKSGTQLHNLTFAFKLCCALMLREKYNVTLPMIIDSPRSGEVGLEASKLMIKVLKKYLPENQLIVASIYDDYELNFDQEIVLEKGVVNELEKFIN